LNTKNVYFTLTLSANAVDIDNWTFDELAKAVREYQLKVGEPVNGAVFSSHQMEG
jgi:PX domain